MDDEDKPSLTLVSSRDEEEIKRQQVLCDLDWPMREMAANLLRITRGAGRPTALPRQIIDVALAIQGAGEFSNAWHIGNELERVLHEGMPKYHDWDDFYYADQQLIRGSLQTVASTLLNQHAQTSAGDRERSDGIDYHNRIIERRRQERLEREAALGRAAPIKKKRKPRTKIEVRATTPSRPLVPTPAETTPDEPEPKPVSTSDYMKINARRIREGKEPI